MTPEALLRVFDRVAGESSDFDLNPEVVLPPARKLCPAAVLIAVCDAPGGARVILTKRSSRLKHHPGQIARSARGGGAGPVIGPGSGAVARA